jgi:hypothetical protein
VDPSRARKPFRRSYAPKAFAMFDDSNQYDDFVGATAPARSPRRSASVQRYVLGMSRRMAKGGL